MSGSGGAAVPAVALAPMRTIPATGEAAIHLMSFEDLSRLGRPAKNPFSRCASVAGTPPTSVKPTFPRWNCQVNWIRSPVWVPPRSEKAQIVAAYELGPTKLIATDGKFSELSIKLSIPAQHV